MIQLTSRAGAPLPDGCFPDHLDQQVVHHLPDALAVVERDDGRCDFNLARYGGDGSDSSGGFISGCFEVRRQDLDELRLSMPATRWEAVDFESASVRLFVRSRTADATLQNGDWHPVPLSGNRRFRIAASLTKLDASLLAHLLAEGDESVEMELKLKFSGLVSGVPGYAIIDREQFMGQMRALAGARGLRRDEIVAAYLSLAVDETIEFRPLNQAEPLTVEQDLLMQEVALRSFERFFERAETDVESASDLYRLTEAGEIAPGQITVALHTPRVEEREHRLSWSVSELYQVFTDADARRAHFSFVGEVSPFSEVRIPIANSLPFDPAFLRRVVVDVRFTSVSGILEHQTFRFPDDGELQEINTHFPSMNTGFVLETRVRSLLSPPGGGGWPVAWPRDAAFVGEPSRWIEITPERARVCACSVAVDARAFERASRIVCSLCRHADDGPSSEVASVKLAPGRESAAIVVPVPDDMSELELVCVAFPPEDVPGDGVALHSVFPYPRHLTIPIHGLEVLVPDVVEARLPDGVPEGVVFAAVEFRRASEPEDAEGALRTFSLEHAHPVVTWKTWRESVFESMRYCYRTHFVVKDDSGRSLPMQSGPWIEASDHNIEIEFAIHA